MLLRCFCLIFTATLHTVSLHLFALKWSQLPLLHSGHWHNVLCVILSLHKNDYHLLHLSRSCCEKTDTQHPKQPKLCKQIGRPSTGKSGLFIWSMIESFRDDDFLWNVVGVFHDQVLYFFLLQHVQFTLCSCALFWFFILYQCFFIYLSLPVIYESYCSFNSLNLHCCSK